LEEKPIAPPMNEQKSDVKITSKSEKDLPIKSENNKNDNDSSDNEKSKEKNQNYQPVKLKKVRYIKLQQK